ncbi:hypothetical protein FOLKNPGA_01748 [Legionella sp. PC1000]|nr:hypothetical protein FOLKNPGA_01748 [Legionella sp. PC1000]
MIKQLCIGSESEKLVEQYHLLCDFVPVKLTILRVIFS